MAHGEALRIRVIKAVVEDGLSRNEAVRIFRVGIASVVEAAFEYLKTIYGAEITTSAAVVATNQ